LLLEPVRLAVLPLMLKVRPADRPLNAVASSRTRATATPICHNPTLLTGEVIRRPYSTTASITSSLSATTSQERT
jgi:hypothetical protein